MFCCICVGNGAGTREEKRGLDGMSRGVYKVLREQGIEVKIITIKDWNQEIPKCDFVFNLCDNDEGTPDSFINFTRYLEERNIPYTGNNQECFKHHYDKFQWSKYSGIKKFLPKRGISIPFNIGLKPIIVKPRFSHGSLQPIKMYKNMFNAEMYKDLKTGNYYWEQYIEGREITVPCLPDGRYFAGEYIYGKKKILDFQEKWHGNHSLAIPILSDSIKRRISQIVKEVRQALHITAYMRLDLRVDADDNVYLIDINPNCSIDPEGTYCKVLKLYRIMYGEIISKIYKELHY